MFNLIDICLVVKQCNSFNFQSIEITLKKELTFVICVLLVFPHGTSYVRARLDYSSVKYNNVSCKKF